MTRLGPISDSWDPKVKVLKWHGGLEPVWNEVKINEYDEKTLENGLEMSAKFNVTESYLKNIYAFFIFEQFIQKNAKPLMN